MLCTLSVCGGDCLKTSRVLLEEMWWYIPLWYGHLFPRQLCVNVCNEDQCQQMLNVNSISVHDKSSLLSSLSEQKSWKVLMLKSFWPVITLIQRLPLLLPTPIQHVGVGGTIGYLTKWWMDECTDGWTDGRTDGWMWDAWMDRMDEWMDRWMNGVMPGWIDGWQQGRNFSSRTCLAVEINNVIRLCNTLLMGAWQEVFWSLDRLIDRLTRLCKILQLPGSAMWRDPQMQCSRHSLLMDMRGKPGIHLRHTKIPLYTSWRISCTFTQEQKNNSTEPKLWDIFNLTMKWFFWQLLREGCSKKFLWFCVQRRERFQQLSFWKFYYLPLLELRRETQAPHCFQLCEDECPTHGWRQSPTRQLPAVKSRDAEEKKKRMQDLTKSNNPNMRG